ncbi:MAG: hypothetical protein NTV77_02435, partial [Candidatus Azambacteria bacterium]|nr:hypothetical protein [Candidatus Azambacteria bacterium]
GYPVIVAVAPNGQNFTGGEITKVMYGDVNYWPNMTDITSSLYVVYADGSLHPLSAWTGSSHKLVLFFDNGSVPAGGYPLAAGAVNWNVLTITPNAAIAPGTYQIYAQYAANLATYATAQYAQ